jgi:glycosyltransferase involved in cell wall biosynthesis
MRCILMLVDWLPPDFGAVGQYALMFAEQFASQGNRVTLVGFSSRSYNEEIRSIGKGELKIRRLYRPPYDKSLFLSRAAWTLGANTRLLWGARREFFKADEIRFSGAPPFVLHFIAPIGWLFRRKLVYRITDFHPECLIAAYGRAPSWLRAVRALTWFWRRRITRFEILGEDQRRRLREGGIPEERMVLVRDPSPVRFEPDTAPAKVPDALRGLRVVLYSGNWGVAHDSHTFVAGFAAFCAAHPGKAGVWLNATGKRADEAEQLLRERGITVVRTQPVPLHQLGSVLKAADLHLITLDDRFVGYVLPSKVYACIESRRPVLFIGHADSDVHLLCSQQLDPQRYRRVGMGDVASAKLALEHFLAKPKTP